MQSDFPIFDVCYRFQFELLKILVFTEFRAVTVKAKVVNLTNHKTTRTIQQTNQTCSGCPPEARENECECVKIGLGFTSDWLRKWREIFNQSLSVVTQTRKQNYSRH